jgi:hypothetical protein
VLTIAISLIGPACCCQLCPARHRSGVCQIDSGWLVC